MERPCANQPTFGALTSQAVAEAKIYEAEHGLKYLTAIRKDLSKGYQP